MITVFTPTYNRAYTLPRLYESLLKQDCFDFEWLVINDGSTDNTDELFKQWVNNATFLVRYIKVANGGKQRAINRALTLAKGEYFFIVDSDDWLDSKAISFIKHAFATLPLDKSLIGLSGIREGGGRSALNGSPKIDPNVGFVDASNLEREKWNLAADMAEVFFTDKLRQYSFPVWEGENFTPEAVVWDQMAVDG